MGQLPLLPLLLFSVLWTENYGIDIKTADDLRELSARVAIGNTYKDMTIFLQNDIDLEGIPFTPIGNSKYHFKGKFDGLGHKISNLNITVSSRTGSSTLGLFGHYPVW